MTIPKHSLCIIKEVNGPKKPRWEWKWWRDTGSDDLQVTTKVTKLADIHWVGQWGRDGWLHQVDPTLLDLYKRACIYYLNIVIKGMLRDSRHRNRQESEWHKDRKSLLKNQY